MCNGGEASWARIIAPVGGDSASHLSAVELTLIWISEVGKLRETKPRPMGDDLDVFTAPLCSSPCVCPAFVYRPVSLTVFAGAENNVWLVNCSKKGRVKV